MSWLGKVFPYVGFLERQVEELQAVNHRLTDQLLKATGNEPIYEQRPFDSALGKPFGSAQGKPVKTRQTMEDYLRQLEAEEQKLLQEEMTALAKENQAGN